MNIDAAVAAVDTLITDVPGFQALWGELNMDQRIAVLSDVQLAIEQEVY